MVQCVEPGSSCSACPAPPRSPARVCTNTYTRIRLRAKGNSDTDIGWDTFSFPSGCDCYQ